MFLRQYAFLFLHFTPAIYFHGAAFTIRHAWMILAPVAAVERPALQVIMVASALLFWTGSCIRQFPWRTPLVNMVDVNLSAF